MRKIKKNILIIDDEQINRTLIKMVISRLNNFNIKIFEAETGKEALNLIENQKFNIILLDLLLPDINGISLIDEIFKHNENTKLFIVSALSEKESGFNEIKSKNIKYISKPFDINYFKEILQEALKS